MEVLTENCGGLIINVRKVNESSGQGEIPYRQYSLRTLEKEPIRCDSVADSYSLDERRIIWSHMISGDYLFTEIFLWRYYL